MKKMTLKWLERHINFYEKDILKLLTEIELILNQKGFEIEDVKFINPLIVTEITSFSKKEGVNVAICETKISENIQKYLYYETETVQVLCGAKNPRIGMKTVLAPLKSQIGSFIIEKRTIKGLESFGMFCSYDEIKQWNSNNYAIQDLGNLQNFNTEGIVELEKINNPIFALEDVLIKVSTPTNRWDLMSVRGIARELAFAGLGDFKELKQFTASMENNLEIINKTNVKVDFCEVKNIEISSKIITLLNRISEPQFCNLKYLNDFILQDIGHPIHIYDAESINTISIEQSKPNEEFITLKNTNFKTNGKEVLIKMGKDMESLKTACIGGIIGIDGFSENTKNVIVEAGYFKKEHISELTSEASKLFNLGIDFNQNILTYVQTLISGNISKIIKSGNTNIQNKELILSTADFFKVTNLAITPENICNNLNKYGFQAHFDRINLENKITDEFVIKTSIPSWRNDINIKEDLVEEILRIIGLDEYLKETPNVVLNGNLKYSDIYQEIRNIMTVEGFTEMYNFPFSSSGEVKIKNSMNVDKSYLRNNLLESLTLNCEETLNHGNANVLIYEIGKVYPSEEIKLGILVSGLDQRSWNKSQKQFDLFYLKGVLQKLSVVINIDFNSIINLENENYSYGLKFNNGIIGKIKNNKKDIFYAEFSIKKAEKFIKMNSQQKIYKDLSVKLNKNISFEKIGNELYKEVALDFYVFDYFAQDEFINYGITLIFDGKRNMNEIELIYNQVKKEIESL